MSEEKLPPSRTAPQFIVRFPLGMREQLAEAAKQNNRSINAEIVERLRLFYPLTQEVTDLRAQLARAEGLRAEAKAEVAALSGQRDALQAEMRRLVEEDTSFGVQKLRAALADADSRIAQLTKELEEARTQLTLALSMAGAGGGDDAAVGSHIQRIKALEGREKELLAERDRLRSELDAERDAGMYLLRRLSEQASEHHAFLKMQEARCVSSEEALKGALDTQKRWSQVLGGFVAHLARQFPKDQQRSPFLDFLLQAGDAAAAGDFDQASRLLVELELKRMKSVGPDESLSSSGSAQGATVHETTRRSAAGLDSYLVPATDVHPGIRVTKQNDGTLLATTANALDIGKVQWVLAENGVTQISLTDDGRGLVVAQSQAAKADKCFQQMLKARRAGLRP